eukprot:Rmarinus@m.23167
MFSIILVLCIWFSFSWSSFANTRPIVWHQSFSESGSNSIRSELFMANLTSQKLHFFPEGVSGIDLFYRYTEDGIGTIDSDLGGWQSPDAVPVSIVLKKGYEVSQSTFVDIQEFLCQTYGGDGGSYLFRPSNMDLKQARNLSLWDLPPHDRDHVLLYGIFEPLRSCLIQRSSHYARVDTHVPTTGGLNIRQWGHAEFYRTCEGIQNTADVCANLYQISIGRVEGHVEIVGDGNTRIDKINNIDTENGIGSDGGGKETLEPRMPFDVRYVLPRSSTRDALAVQDRRIIFDPSAPFPVAHVSCEETDCESIRTRVPVSRSLDTSGFHPTLYSKIDLSRLHLDNVSEDAKCEAMLLETLPPSVFFDSYALRERRKFYPSTKAYPLSSPDLEKPESDFSSKQGAVALHAEFSFAQRELEFLLPIHFRYHSPSQEMEQEFNISAPQLYMKCKGTGSARGIDLGEMFFPDQARDEFGIPLLRLQDQWQPVPLTETVLVARIPVGNSGIASAIIVVTIIVTLLGTLLVAIHPMKSKVERSHQE